MSPIETKRTAAIKVADALNMIEGVPVSAFAKDLSAKWAKGEITGADMKAALIAKTQEGIIMKDLYLIENSTVLKNLLDITNEKELDLA